MIGHKEESLNSIIYPHSITLSAEGVKPNDLYKVFEKSIFSIYLSIFSFGEFKDYSVYLSIIDLNNYVAATETNKHFVSLESEEYETYMKSIFLIFQPFSRHILNFEKKPITLQQFYEQTQLWLEEIKVKVC